MFALDSEADEILFPRHFRLTPKSEPKWDRILDCIDENGGGARRQATKAAPETVLAGESELCSH
jgi:hypothetical protein